MNEVFEQALRFVFRWEGGLSDDVYDNGGITKYGVSIKFLQSIDPKATEDTIRNLTKEEAKQLFYEHFWIPCRCDLLPANVAIAVFDTAVNCGAPKAIKLLQSALGGLIIDGIIGEATIKAIKEANEELLLSSYLYHRRQFYMNIVAKHPKQKMFLKGWLNRVYALAELTGCQTA